MRIKVTFEDILDVENEEQAYDLLIDFCNEVAKNEDVTAFTFEGVHGSVFLSRIEKKKN